MKKKKKISVQTIIEVMIRAVFFIIYPALFSTAFTGIKLIVEQITQRASLPWNSFETVEMFFKSGKDTPVFKICCTACCPASLYKRLQ